uniref:Flap endonuclease 1 n=2 Tax=Lygus hesperus TaxID=30085 RepID=A0A0A9XDJ0_LYGHE
MNFFFNFQMNTLLNKIQESAAVVELRSVDSLTLDTPYAVTKMMWTQTKYGPAVQFHLQELTEGQQIEGGDTFRVYLPRRISNVLTENEVEKYNASQMVYTLVYRGKSGNASLIDVY